AGVLARVAQLRLGRGRVRGEQVGGSMATPYERAANYQEWTESADYRAAVAETTRRLEADGIEAVYFVSPSVDGRPIGKMVTREQFPRFAARGIRMHPLSFTDFRSTLWGDPIGYGQEDAENAM